MKRILLMCMMWLVSTMSAQITLGSGTSSGPAPVSTYYGYSYVQQIFPKSEINANAAGNITGLKFYLSSTATLTNSNAWVVYIGHTSKTSFTSTSDWVPVANLTKVFDGTVTNNSGVVEVTFTTPFAYNNVDNLVIAAEENKQGYDSNNSSEAMYVYASSANSALYYRNDSTNPDPAGTLPAGTQYGNKSIVTLVGLTASATPSCPVITAPAAAATGVSVTPTISWSAVNGATGYKLSVGTTAGGTDVLNNQDITTGNSYTFTAPLLYSKQYYYSVNAYSSGGTSAGCAQNNFTTANIPCPTVTAPALGAFGLSTTPTITWTAVTGATGYKLSVGTTAGGTNVLNNQDLGNVTTYTFSSALAAGTKYYYTLNSYNANSTSASCTERTFSTLCAASTVFSQNFDSVTTPDWPMCWGKVGSAGSAYTQASTAMSSPNNMYIYASSTSSLPVVSMPPVSTLQSGNYRLRFKARGNSTAGGKIEVGYLTNPADATTFVNLSTFTTTSTTTVDNFVVSNITAPSGVTTLAFRHTGSPAYSVLIDDVVYELVPSCDAPSLLAASAVTSNSATISWTAPSAAPGSGYQLYYSTSSTAPTATTTPSIASITSTTANLPATLSASTQYYVWVRSNCGSSQSAWSSVLTFTTDCLPVSTLPWSENFDAMTTVGANILPTCWASTAGGYSSTENYTSATTAGNTYNDPKSAPNYVTIYYPSTNAAYLWTPKFALTAGQSYDFTFYWVGDGLTGWQGDVVVNGTQSATGATSLSTFLTPTQTATGGSESTNYTKVKVTFVPTATGNYTFGVKTLATTYAPYYLGFDDFNLMLSPACAEPAALSVSSVTTSGATLSWTAPATAPSGYQVYYSTSSTAPTATTTPTITGVTGTTATLPNLTPGTTYYVWVRSNCGSSQSIWSSSVSFTTACVATTVPYTLNFDNVTVPSLPVCGSVVNAGSGKQWVTAAAPTDITGFNSNVLKYGYDGTNAANAWFFTQGLTLTAGTQYTISYKYGNNSTFYTEKMKVAYGTSATVAGMTSVLADYSTINDNTLHTESITFTPTASGTYYFGFNAYSAANQYNLYVDDISIINAALGTSEVAGNRNDIRVYPNPFTEVLHISDISKVKSVSVTDVAGRLVKTFANPAEALHLSELNSGMYLVTLDMKDGSKQTIKVIKK